MYFLIDLPICLFASVSFTCFYPACSVVFCFGIHCLIFFFFFFSSRRRHTRSLCDWSSDVCSSDLSFSNQTDLPLRVGLLIDTSNSSRDRFQFEQQAAIEFLSQIMRPKADQAFVLGFDTVAEVTQDFTNNTEKLSSGVRMLRPGGGTALFDALYQASRDKLMKNSAGQAVRRAIILVSDGNDNQSRVTREQAIEMAQRAEVIVYTISTNTSGMIERGDRILQRIADESGGRAFFPLKLQEVSDAFS